MSRLLDSLVAGLDAADLLSAQASHDLRQAHGPAGGGRRADGWLPAPRFHDAHRDLAAAHIDQGARRALLGPVAQVPAPVAPALGGRALAHLPLRGGEPRPIGEDILELRHASGRPVDPGVEDGNVRAAEWVVLGAVPALPLVVAVRLLGSRARPLDLRIVRNVYALLAQLVEPLPRRRLLRLPRIPPSRVGALRHLRGVGLLERHRDRLTLQAQLDVHDVRGAAADPDAPVRGHDLDVDAGGAPARARGGGP